MEVKKASNGVYALRVDVTGGGQCRLQCSSAHHTCSGAPTTINRTPHTAQDRDQACCMGIRLSATWGRVGRDVHRTARVGSHVTSCNTYKPISIST